MGLPQVSRSTLLMNDKGKGIILGTRELSIFINFQNLFSGAFRCIYCNEKLTAHLIDLHVCPPVDMATELSNNDQRDNEICIEFADDVFDHEEEVQFTTEQERRINDLQFQDDDNGRRKNGKGEKSSLIL